MIMIINVVTLTVFCCGFMVYVVSLILSELPGERRDSADRSRDAPR